MGCNNRVIKDKKLAVKVSVILPVYNVENQIDRCIESLRSQSLKELEFIFVDDCSNDKSLAAVEAWACEDCRVHIIKNNENIGPGPSRNRGIEMAQGEYLSFVDPDDYISDHFYELLYAAACEDGGHDIAKGLRVIIDSKSDEDRSRGERRIIIIRDNVGVVPLYSLFVGGHFTAIYRRELFEDKRVRYGTSRKSEDTTFQLRICLQTEDIIMEPRAEYYYVYNEYSLTACKTSMRFNDEIEGMREKISAFRGRGLDENACRYIAERLLYHLHGYRAAAKYDSDLHHYYINYFRQLIKTIDALPEKETILRYAKDVQKLYKCKKYTRRGFRNRSKRDIRVSVILPIGSSEELIKERIEELKRQLLEGLEFIFVDDCSDDSVLAVVEAWAACDDRVRVVHNDKVMGIEASIKRGKEIARGRFLSFPNSEDVIKPYYYDLFYAQAIELKKRNSVLGKTKRLLRRIYC